MANDYFTILTKWWYVDKVPILSGYPNSTIVPNMIRYVYESDNWISVLKNESSSEDGCKWE